MPSQIDDYIRKSLDSGFSREQITTNLRKVGWPQSQIDGSFDSMQDNMQPDAPAYSPTADETAEKEGIEEVDRFVANKYSGDSKTNTMAIIAFAVSLLGLFLFGFILGIIALSQIKKSGEKGKTFAIIAIVLSVLSFITLVLVIGALAYFGVMNPSNILPEKCTGMSGMDCLEKAIISTSANTITFPSKENLGQTITIVGMTASGTQNSCANEGQALSRVDISVEGGAAHNVLDSADTVTVKNGERFVVTILCPKKLAAGMTQADFTMLYNSQESMMTGQRAVYSIRGTAI